MLDLDKIYIYRLTHIQNIPHILDNGITHQNSPNANKDYIAIGDSSIINTRAEIILDNGKHLGDYIPFYFATRTPMLYVIQKGFNLVRCTQAEDIVYCVASIQKIIDHSLDFVFTNGHAVDSLTTQYGRLNLAQINEILDWQAIKALYWKNEEDLDLKRRKEAEFLVLGDIPYNCILGFYVYNDKAMDTMKAFGVEERRIIKKPNLYF